MNSKDINRMNVYEKIESLRFLAQIHRQQFDERRKIEWRAVFTTLTFFVLCVAAVFIQHANLPDSIWFIFLMWLLFVGLALIMAFFLTSLHRANCINKQFAQRAEDSIGELIENNQSAIISPFKNTPIVDIYWTNFFKRNHPEIWAWRWQVIILFAFAIISALLLTFS